MNHSNEKIRDIRHTQRVHKVHSSLISISHNAIFFHISVEVKSPVTFTFVAEVSVCRLSINKVSLFVLETVLLSLKISHQLKMKLLWNSFKFHISPREAKCISFVSCLADVDVSVRVHHWGTDQVKQNGRWLKRAVFGGLHLPFRQLNKAAGLKNVTFQFLISKLHQTAFPEAPSELEDTIPTLHSNLLTPQSRLFPENCVYWCVFSSYALPLLNGSLLPFLKLKVK